MDSSEELNEMNSALLDFQQSISSVSVVWTDSVGREFLERHMGPIIQSMQNYLVYAERLLEEIEIAEIST